MGFLSNLFGKKKSTEQPTASSTQSTESSTQTIDAEIFPILKPGNWVGLKAGCLHRPFIGTNEQPHLVIAYAYNHADGYIFINNENNEGRTPQQTVTEAHANLDNGQVEVQDFEHGAIITASGKDFSSEKILSKPFLDSLHKRFDSDQIIVSIPRRTIFYAMAGNAAPHYVDMFINAHKYTFDDDSFGNAPITDHIFIVKDGEIENILNVNEDASEAN